MIKIANKTSFKISIHLMKMTAQPEKDFKRSTIQILKDKE